MKFCFGITLLLLLSSSAILAQEHENTYEAGLFIGRASIQTDYGERGDFESAANNASISYSLVHYTHFFNKLRYWGRDFTLLYHIMIKSEINFLQGANLKHYGKHIKGPSLEAEKLRAMKGKISMLNLGVSFEYHFIDLYEYMNGYNLTKLNPYLSFGVKYNFFKNSLSSDLGDWEQDISVLPQKYQTPGALALGSDSVFSFTAGVGLRYRLSELLDLSGIVNFEVFMSDNIDGLQANVIENKNNEWLVNLQLGLIYHLNFYTR